MSTTYGVGPGNIVEESYTWYDMNVEFPCLYVKTSNGDKTVLVFKNGSPMNTTNPQNLPEEVKEVYKTFIPAQLKGEV